MQPSLVFCLSAALISVSSMDQSRESQTDNYFDLGAIEIIKVTEQRASDWFDPVGATVSLEDIRLFDRENVATAISLLPGVNLQNVGARNELLVTVRGFDSRQVPVYIDGIPVYVPYDGNIDLSRLTTANISEINVSKGFTSMLYGANTLGGSINVITQRPRQPLELDLGATLTGDREFDQSGSRLYFNAGTQQALWYAQFGAAQHETGFFRLPSDFTPTAAEDGGRRQNSSARDRTMSLKLGLTPNSTDEYALSYQNLQGRKDNPPYAGTTPGVNVRYWRWPNYDKESLYFIGRTAISSNSRLGTRIYYDKFDNTLRSFDDATFTTQSRPFAFDSIYDDYTWGANLELRNDSLAGHSIGVAAHYKTDVHRENDGDTSPTERFEDEWFSLGIEDQWSIASNLTLVTGLSYDRLEGKQADDLSGPVPNQFGLTSESAINAQAAILYDLSKQLTGRFSIARRTRFPTIKDRYSFRLGSALPNPGLQPEVALNYELGLGGTREALDGAVQFIWSGAVFYNDIEDGIESVAIAPTACPSPPCSQLQNVGEVRQRGLEAMATVQIGEQWKVHANYTWLDKDNKTNSNIKPLNVPDNSLFSYLSYTPSPTWEFLLSLEFGDGRYSSTDGVRVTDAYTVYGLKGIWHASSQLQFELGARNLTDKLFALDEGFFAPGRQYYGTVRWTY